MGNKEIPTNSPQICLTLIAPVESNSPLCPIASTGG